MISSGIRRVLLGSAVGFACALTGCGGSGDDGNDGTAVVGIAGADGAGALPGTGMPGAGAQGQPAAAPGSTATPANGAAPMAADPGAPGASEPPGPAGTAGAGSTPAMTPGNGTCLAAGSGQYTEPGPYKVGMMDVDLGMGICPGQSQSKFTIFYPTPLDAACPHPIVAWGNGTAVADATTYAFFNQNAASWGMVVIASWDPGVGCGNYHKKGIDYLLAQNADPSSMFFNKLSTRAGVAGHSQGGIGATLASSHKNVEALVSVAGGGVPPANVAVICLTGTQDLVEAACSAGVAGAAGPAFLADYEGADHFISETVAGYIARQPATLQMQRLMAAWFRCFLADDQTACGMFKGPPGECGICKDPGWAKIEGRNM